MKTLILTTLFALNAFATNEQYTIKKVDESIKNYSYKIAFPELKKHVVPGFENINSSIQKKIETESCEITEGFQPTDDNQYDYDVTSTVVTINPQFVTYKINTESFCGGAHPNGYTQFVTFDAQSGELVNFDKEVPSQALSDNPTDEEFKKWDEYHNQLAKIVYKNLSKKQLSETKKCASYLNDEKPVSTKEVLDFIASSTPKIEAATIKKKVIITTSVPHVISGCELSVDVPYLQVKSFVSSNQKLSNWLK